tara:strand:+ start:11938 stop:14124 length:2187 start_codon:yes stop_codon:yes gene_type:complete
MSYKQFTYLLVISSVIIIFLFGLNFSLNYFNISDKGFVLDSINSYCEKLKNSSNKYVGTNQSKIWETKIKNAKDEYNSWIANIGLANSELRLGNFENSRKIINKFLQKNNLARMDEVSKIVTLETAALIYLKSAEYENCVIPGGSIICQLPIDQNYVHQKTNYSKEALNILSELILIDPENIKAKWLLNVTHMNLGSYPDLVDRDLLIDITNTKNSNNKIKFKDISVNLGIYNVDLAGGVIFDDFNNDGFSDIITSSWNPCTSMKFYLNRGIEGFVEITNESNLNKQLGGLNIVSTDYNNDGYIDIYIMRGGWLSEEGEMINTLLRNNKDLTFTDVTEEVGLLNYAYPSQSAAWGDYDNDGDLDLFSCNESEIDENQIPKYPSQLFINENNKFVDVSGILSPQNNRYCKSADWGDYNNDGYIDLFVSNYAGGNRLYKNFGNNKFVDIATELEITNPYYSFTSWFWDYDNDGDLDILSSGYEYGIVKSIKSYQGYIDEDYSIKIFTNDGKGRFEENSKKLNLNKVHSVMGGNYGDLNNDGYEDIYFGTGYPYIDSIIPNAFYINNKGLNFIDETHSYGLGHLQKGHGIGFADFDLDGDLDIFEQMGGFYLSDGFTNLLYENPGNSNNWIGIILKRSNEKTIVGTTISLNCGNEITYNSTVDNGGSFGSSSFIQTLGLNTCDNIVDLEIIWASTNNSQNFKNVPVNKYILIREFEDSYKNIQFKVGETIE